MDEWGLLVVGLGLEEKRREEGDDVGGWRGGSGWLLG